MAKIYNTDTNIDLNGVYLWQYEMADKIKSLIADKREFLRVNVTEFFDNWFDDFLNIDTANTAGLDLWGILLGVYRPSYIEGGVEVLFDDEQYRRLLKGRIMLMMSSGTIHEINAYINYLFPNRPVFAADYLNMSISVIFYYTPTAKELAVIQQDGFLPRPAGVDVNYYIVPPDEVFGFDGQELSTFDNGTFLA